jgi:hypothetical protein
MKTHAAIGIMSFALAGCSLVTVPVKTAGSIVTTTVETTGKVVTAPFEAVGRSAATKPEEEEPAARKAVPVTD